MYKFYLEPELQSWQTLPYQNFLYQALLYDNYWMWIMMKLENYFKMKK